MCLCSATNAIFIGKMQCHEMRLSEIPLLTAKEDSKPIRAEKEAIHSGHFMVSHFEAEAQDDEYDVAVPVPETRYLDTTAATSELQVFDVNKPCIAVPPGQSVIETSLTKLFQCMSLAYRQKLTSPKWNRFKGIRLRWKDKIRLNNVIWRCWHMQFIKKKNTLVCQFASPLDEGTHNKPEAVVLEGKYWKRKLAAVTAEYKKWRMFYRNKIMGWACKDSPTTDVDILDWHGQSNDSTQMGSMMVDEDYMELMSDTLFTTITSNQPFAFPDTREIARGASLADFIQPSLVQLQPNLDDFINTFEPLQGFFSPKLPSVPEEPDLGYRSGQTLSVLDVESQTPVVPNSEQSLDFRVTAHASAYQPTVNYSDSLPSHSGLSGEIKTARFYQPKVRSQQIAYCSRASSPKPMGQEFFGVQAVPDKSPIETGLSNNSFKFESVESEPSGERTMYFPAAETGLMQQTFKLPMSSPKMHQPYKFHQQQKESTLTLASRCNRIPQNYESAASLESKPLPGITSNTVAFTNIAKSISLPSINTDDTFILHKQHVTSKSRHRTRSGSSLASNKARTQPPPFSSANSDSALNISGALLAQLLTNNHGVYNIQHGTDRYYRSHSINKSANVPILPMPMKATCPQNKILPELPQGTLIVNSAGASAQNFLGAGRPFSGPGSPKDSCIQSVPSPGTLSQSPTSPVMFSGSLTPPKLIKQDAVKATAGLNEHRRVCHINAEQKRRYNIKNGFDVLHSLIPHLHQNPNVKVSKAVMLQKGAEYIRQLQAERLQAKEDMEGLRYQIENLNISISNCQSLLPATGAPVSRHRTTKMKEMFDEFVRIRTMENWKFWIFSKLFEPLLQSFSCSVSTASYDDLYRSTLIWVEQHCSLVDLRPAVFNSLRNLSTSTEILTDPSKLPEEARTAVNNKRT